MHHKNRPYFTEDHEMFRKSVRTFVEKELLPHQKEWEEKKFVPKEVFKKLGDQGFLGINYPAEYGGSGCDLWYKVVFAEEMTHARMNGFAMDVFVQTDITSPVIEKLGTPEQKKEILEPAIKGEKILALGVTEPSGGSDVARIRTTAKKVGNEYVINGSKTFITNGSRADYIVLAVRTGCGITDKETFKNAYQGLSFILFPTQTETGKTRPGFSVGRKLVKMGNDSSDTAELSFSDCRVAAKYLLGEENKGFYYIMQNFQGERLITAVMSVASSRQLWNDAVAYLNERQAFGRRLVDFQVWQHRFAQWAAEIEAAQELTYRAVDLYNRKIPCVKEITMAKLITTELVNKLASDCVQAHGGYGYMAEYDVSRIYRDVRLLTIGAGASEIMREILVKECGLVKG